jgi:hypothetical protein
MPHPLVNKPKRDAAEAAANRQALNSNQYVGAIFVGRRKVWEARASTKEEAFNKAKAQEAQYSSAGANPEIQVKKVKPSAV